MFRHSEDDGNCFFFYRFPTYIYLQHCYVTAASVVFLYVVCESMTYVIIVCSAVLYLNHSLSFKEQGLKWHLKYLRLRVCIWVSV